MSDSNIKHYLTLQYSIEPSPSQSQTVQCLGSMMEISYLKQSCLNSESTMASYQCTPSYSKICSILLNQAREKMWVAAWLWICLIVHKTYTLFWRSCITPFTGITIVIVSKEWFCWDTDGCAAIFPSRAWSHWLWLPCSSGWGQNMKSQNRELRQSNVFSMIILMISWLLIEDIQWALPH